MPQENKIVFVATYPDRQRKCPDFMNALEDLGVIVLHPSYDYNSESGKKTTELLGDKPPTDKNHYKSLVLSDFWSISKADIVVYDADRDPGHQFLAAATIHKKPVIVASSVLKSIDPYFSGLVRSVVKYEDVIQHISFFISLPKKKVQKKEVKTSPKEKVSKAKAPEAPKPAKPAQVQPQRDQTAQA